MTKYKSTSANTLKQYLCNYFFSV